jgi:signal transduction histidine kinase
MGYLRLIWFTLAGIVVGYLLMHTFAMLAYVLDPQHPQASLGFNIWKQQMRLAFSREMLAMGGAFAFMGGISGFFLGAWSLQKERWLAEKLESQKRLVALETTKDLMVTLAHYIRNSNMVIGGFSAHLLKYISDREFVDQLLMIQQASRKIEAVVNSLQSLTEISTLKYTDEGQARIIDLKKELEAHLSGSASKESNTAAIKPPVKKV